MCKHFGVPYTGPVPEQGGKAAHDDHYRLEADGSMRCKYCGMSFSLKSNKAVRPIARYFLSLSLPFADCSNIDCDNHGLNVFEHFVGGDIRHQSRGIYYRAGDDYRAGCKKCRSKDHKESKKAKESGEARNSIKFKFTLGEARQKGEVDLWLKRRLIKIIECFIHNISVTDRLELLAKLDVRQRNRELSKKEIRQQEKIKINPDSYYNQSIAIAHRLRDYQSWRNAKLLDPRANVDRKTPARVYTDVMQVSLKQFGEGARHQFLNIIVSVLALERSGFILAAHPSFIPEEYSIKILELLSQVRFYQPGYADEWDCLWHPGKIDARNIADVIESGELPDIGRDGFFINSPYAEAAHFLTVQKMLSRFDKVYYYMDAAQDLYPAALCALADSVRSGQVEIALFQHDKESKAAYSKSTDETKRRALDKANKAMEARFRRRSKPKKGELPFDERERRANLYKNAFRGANTKNGGWAWLTYPPNNRQYRNCRSLWLTRMPNKTFAKDAAGLMFNANLQPVDSLMSSMRQRTRALGRPLSRAKPGRSFVRSYELIDSVLSELWIYLLHRNYRLRIKTDQETIPAHLLGLMTDDGAGLAINTVPEDDFLDIFLDFRLDLRHAERISKWQQQ